MDDLVETPSQRRFFAFCLVAAALSLVVVALFSVTAWLLLPIAAMILAALTFLNGYWQQARQ